MSLKTAAAEFAALLALTIAMVVLLGASDYVDAWLIHGP